MFVAAACRWVPGPRQSRAAARVRCADPRSSTSSMMLWYTSPRSPPPSPPSLQAATAQAGACQLGTWTADREHLSPQHRKITARHVWPSHASISLLGYNHSPWGGISVGEAPPSPSTRSAPAVRLCPERQLAVFVHEFNKLASHSNCFAVHRWKALSCSILGSLFSA